MKKFLLGTIALVALGTASAVAADLPARTYTKAPAYAAPVYNWTGFYIGAHVGGAFTNNNSFPVAGFGNSGSTGSFLGGGQIGADYQFAPNWVLGIEGQFSGLSNQNRSFTSPGFVVGTNNNDYLGSVTGRLGYTWGPAMLYAKGGVGFEDNNSYFVNTAGGAPVAFTQSGNNKTGYTVGGGLEYMFAPSWSAKVEYQYYDFGTSGFTSNLGAVSFKDDVHTVKAGVNYHF
jgi:outer membrane immunogenic protein